MKGRRGSAVIFVMVMLMFMTTIVMAYSSLGIAAREAETRREQAVIARLAFDGATLKASYDCGLGNISYPSTQSVPVGATTCSVTIADNSASMSHSLSMTTSASIRGRTFNDSRVIGLKMPLSPFYYCLAMNAATNLGGSVTLGSGGSNGDLYDVGALTLNNNVTVNGDCESSSTFSKNSATVTGTAIGSTNPIPFPVPVAANYSAVASSSLLNILLGIILSGETFTTPYMVIYCGNDTTMSGIFSGKGVLFVNGNVTISGNMTYLLPTDEVAIIATGNVTVQNSNTSIVGYWYCGGTFTTQSNTNLTRGSIVTNTFSPGSNFSATYDPTIWTTGGEAERLKLPGVWP